MRLESDMIIDGVLLKMEQQKEDVQVSCRTKIVLCSFQTIENLEMYIKDNYEIVYEYYSDKMKACSALVNEDKLKECFIEIAMNYVYLYSSWRVTYLKSNYTLSFKQNDFEDSQTRDIIIRFFKKESPENWVKICCILLDMDILAFRGFVQRRDEYFNR